MAATVVLAEALYRFVERPLRVRGGHGEVRPTSRSRARRFTRFAVPALGAAVAMCAASVTVAWANDRPEAYPEEVRDIVAMDRGAVSAERRAETRALCREPKTGAMCGSFAEDEQNVLILGDSVGVEGHLLAEEMWPDANVVTAEKAECPPLRTLDGIQHSFAGCEQLNDRRFESLGENADRIDRVVVAMRLDDERLPHVLDVVAWLTEQGIEESVYGVGPQYDQFVWQVMAMHQPGADAERALYSHLTVASTLNAAYADGVAQRGGQYIDRWSWACQEGACRAHLGDDITDLVMVDKVHMTRDAVVAFAQSVR
ncbi:SGNH hydrolase domain-containing protein [Microbacterium sp. G2-8]|uniref:SGNH hydrolase domain-containing protein n=1 Tax=Microbacterium sp. G2-8 TaxID=2842454 RepID=UPI001C897C8E|nr:SGNH hydrolase domain-containing protein [Microbacterium sp. G2-8]